MAAACRPGPPAVGEKNREDEEVGGFGGVAAAAAAAAAAEGKEEEEAAEGAGRGGLDSGGGAAESRSSDMVLDAPTVLYRPPWWRCVGLPPPGPCSNVFESARFWASAARCTLRCSDQATRPRQARMAAPMKPSAAPTQMKTVPSGRLDFCMKGALAVSGTMTVGMPAPAIVGRPVRWKTERETVVAAAPAVLLLSVLESVLLLLVVRPGALVTMTVGTELAELEPAAAVVFAVADFPLLLPPVAVAFVFVAAAAVPDPSGWETVLRFGRFVAAFVAVVKRRRRRMTGKRTVKGPIDGPFEGRSASLIAEGLRCGWIEAAVGQRNKRRICRLWLG